MMFCRNCLKAPNIELTCHYTALNLMLRRAIITKSVRIFSHESPYIVSFLREQLHPRGELVWEADDGR